MSDNFQVTPEIQAIPELAPIEPDLKKEPAFLISIGVLFLLFCGAYFGTIYYLVEQWFDPDYVYGFFVIPFAGFLLWDRREMLKNVQVKFCAWGIPVVLFGTLISWYALYRYRLTVDAGSIVIVLLGLVLLVGGWQIMRWAWPGVFFLFFMVSLPDYMSENLRIKLQEICTQGSVFILQLLNISAMREGSVIELPDANPLNVATACSGLRTLMLFFAACTGAALYVRRHVAIKIIMVVSAVPIAIFCNTLRITITALVHMGNEEAGHAAHEYAGFIMMPLAIFILWLELTLIEKLFVVDKDEHRPIMGGSNVVIPGVPLDRSRDE